MMNLILIMLFVLMSSLSVSSVSISTSELLALLETVFVNVVDVVDDIRSTDTDIYHLSEQQQSQSKSSFYYDYIVSTLYWYDFIEFISHENETEKYLFK